MVWFKVPTRMICFTVGAGRKLVLPLCSASISQIPGPPKVILPLEIEQTSPEAVVAADQVAIRMVGLRLVPETRSRPFTLTATGTYSEPELGKLGTALVNFTTCGILATVTV